MRVLGVALSLAAVVAACGGSATPSRGGGPAAVRTDRVRIFDDPAKPQTQWGYDPRTIEVAKGTVVTFTNSGGEFHTATSDDPTRAFDVGIDPKRQGTVTFDKAGTWPYHCGVHPDMKGVVQVCDGACK